MKVSNHRRDRRHFKEALRRERARILRVGGYSSLKVLKSAAGWYVGTFYYDAEYKYWAPGSRDSGYFCTQEAAAFHLKALNYHGIYA